MKHSFSVPVLSLCTLAAIQLCAADAPGTKPPKVMAATPVTVYENAPAVMQEKLKPLNMYRL